MFYSIILCYTLEWEDKRKLLVDVTIKGLKNMSKTLPLAKKEHRKSHNLTLPHIAGLSHEEIRGHTYGWNHHQAEGFRILPYAFWEL
jgi:hypothetical protein